MADRVASLHLVRKLAALLRFLNLFHQRQTVLSGGPAPVVNWCICAQMCFTWWPQPCVAGKLDHAVPPAYYLPKAGTMREPCKVRGTRLSVV